ncbi:MAG: hypothetical protein LLG13_16005 [Bacteroidales bacterium]|nr:hypothetical protein [Bacteroidales bacterium]
MKSTIFIICSILFINSCLSAQKSESVTIKSGTRIIDYFPVAERYRYPDFTEGKAIFKNGKIIPGKFNYNFLSGEMQFIRLADTLTVINTKDLMFIAIAQDTFYYNNGYMEMIRNGKFKVFLKQGVVIKDIQKEGAFGTINRSSASESYGYVLTGGRSLDLILTEDVVLQKEADYFYSTPENEFVRFSKKNIIKILPGKEDVIKNYLKSNKTDFESRDNLLRLADFLDDLFH